MIFKMFSVYDVKAAAYLPIFTMVNEAMAVRAFTDSLVNENHTFSRHPEDYHLFCLGEFSDDNADILPDKKMIITGLEALAAFSNSETDKLLSNFTPDIVDNTEKVN